MRLGLDREVARVAGQPAETRDGTPLVLRANLDLPEELESAVEHEAEGIGLLRTEFLVLGRTTLPSEDEQAQFYKRVVHRFPRHPVTVRSYDLGGDKFPAAFRPAPEANPFLGWRAIRVCLDEPALFLAQIRAVLRARVDGDVRLMLPLVTQIEELERTRELVEEAASQLRHEGVEAADHVPVGVMIETPAAALLAAPLAERSDFVSVGTNDLTQYMLAVDRGNARLAERFTPFHPAMVRALQFIQQVTSTQGRELAVCGEMASEPVSVLLLLGLGYRHLSAAPPALPLLRWLVRQIDLAAASRVVEAAVEAATADEVRILLTEELARYVDLELLGLEPVAPE